MIKFSGYQYILFGAYTSKTNFSSIADFRKEVAEKFKKIPFERKAVQNMIKEMIESQPIKDEIGQSEARQILLAQDLKRIINSINNYKISNHRKMLEEHFKLIRKNLEKFSLESEAEMFIVNNFPTPFDTMEWDAAFFEETEKEAFNISPGIYIKEDKIIPYFSTYRLSHELIHTIIGSSGENVLTGLARGFEDGICDVFGSLYLFSGVGGYKMAESTIIQDRFGYWPNRQFPELYRENLIQGLLFYKEFGLDGIVELIRRGRKFIKEVETKIINGDINIKNMKGGYWDENLTKVSNKLLMYPKSLVCSPLARYIAGLIKPGINITKMIKDNNLNLKDTKNAIKELQERLFLIVLNKNKNEIEYDDTKLYVNSGALRYELYPNF